MTGVRVDSTQSWASIGEERLAGSVGRHPSAPMVTEAVRQVFDIAGFTAFFLIGRVVVKRLRRPAKPAAA